MVRRLAVAAAFSLFATGAQAVILTSGANALGAGTTSALEPQLAGSVVEDEITTMSFTSPNGGTFTASIQSRVVLSIDGTYDFYWRIFDTSFTGTDGTALGSLRFGEFGIPLAGQNANYRTDSLGTQGPTSVFVFSDDIDDHFNFNFANGLSAGTDSYFMFIDTDAHGYAKNALMDITNLGQTHISDTFATFGVAEVPEPSTYALMIGGLLGLGFVARRRRKA
jgi:hypothetical protein